MIYSDRTRNKNQKYTPKVLTLILGLLQAILQLSECEKLEQTSTKQTTSLTANNAHGL